MLGLVTGVGMGKYLLHSNDPRLVSSTLVVHQHSFPQARVSAESFTLASLEKLSSEDLEKTAGMLASCIISETDASCNFVL